jgi:hypothetical protein
MKRGILIDSRLMKILERSPGVMTVRWVQEAYIPACAV